MVLGVLTAGGDCPGLNAVIRAVVGRATVTHGMEVVGIRNGWDGLMEGHVQALERDDVRGILQRGGTILGTSRRDPYVHGDGYASVRRTIEANGIDAVIVIGGDGTLRTALALSRGGASRRRGAEDDRQRHSRHRHDVRLRHGRLDRDRGARPDRDDGRVAQPDHGRRADGPHEGLDRDLRRASPPGADAILVPEVEPDLDAVAATIRARHRHGRTYSIVVVAEGCAAPRGEAVSAGVDAFGFERLGGVGYLFGAELERLTGFETRVTVLGHLQRGGTPTAFDRVLATRFGVAAVDLAAAGRFGEMAALRGTDVIGVPLAEACAEVRGVDPALLDVAQTFFG